jgi:hypothetical protein
VYDLKHQKEKRSMDYFAGLDVSVRDTSVCIVDDTGGIIQEVKVASEPDALLAVLTKPTYRFKRIGLEAGPLSQWLFSGIGGCCPLSRTMRYAGCRPGRAAPGGQQARIRELVEGIPDLAVLIEPLLCRDAAHAQCRGRHCDPSC